MSERIKTAEFQKMEEMLVAYLDTLEHRERIEIIDDFLHRLNFERRLTALTDEEREHMNNEQLSQKERQKLTDARTPVEREGLITMYARTTYFRRCAWIDYLNGSSDEKPFTSPVN